MKILKITKGKSGDVVVFLDNDEKLFLAYEVLLKNGLRKGDEISEDLFSYLVTENQKYFIKKRALSLLARRMHSVSELRIKLLQKKYKKELIEEVLKGLTESKILDDQKFALLFAEEKSGGKSWGKVKIKAELIKKGINRDIINEVLTKISSEHDDFQTALELGRKKLRLISAKKPDSRKASQKIMSYLYNKGFDFEICRQVAKELIEKD